MPPATPPPTKPPPAAMVPMPPPCVPPPTKPPPPARPTAGVVAGATAAVVDVATAAAGLGLGLATRSRGCVDALGLGTLARFCGWLDAADDVLRLVVEVFLLGGLLFLDMLSRREDRRGGVGVLDVPATGLGTRFCCCGVADDGVTKLIVRAAPVGVDGRAACNLAFIAFSGSMNVANRQLREKLLRCEHKNTMHVIFLYKSTTLYLLPPHALQCRHYTADDSAPCKRLLMLHRADT